MTFYFLRNTLFSIILLATPPVSGMSNSPSTTESRPNILFIYVDDWGWKDLGVAGSTYYETPSIDKLAGEGIRFTNAYSAAPNCAPSRASLLTGLYTPRHGIYTVGTSERGEAAKRQLIPVENKTVLHTDFTTIAEELKRAGYATSLIGKWQLGNSDQKADPYTQGFEHVISGAPGTSSYFYPYYDTNRLSKSPHIGLDTGKPGEYLTDRLTNEAIKFISAHTTSSFFLYLSYFAVHTPIEAKEELIEKYRAKKSDSLHKDPIYAAMIEIVDTNVGRLLWAVDSLQLSENTVVVFYSDNGGMGVVTNQLPLRGSKGMLYEGGIRVPLIIRWPGQMRPRIEETPVTGVDFYPTLGTLAKIKRPLNKRIDGQSLTPLLFGHKFRSRELFWHFPAYLEAYRGDARNSEPFRTTPVSVVRSGRYKLMEFYEDGRRELYDLEMDIGEHQNLAATHPEKARKLSKKLAVWKKEVGAFEPAEPNPKYQPADR